MSNRQRKFTLERTLDGSMLDTRGKTVEREHGGKWKKGCKSPNPGGRKPLKETLVPILKAEVEEICPLYKNDKGQCTKTWKELLVLALMSQAIKGHPTAIREVWDRLDGKVPLPLASDPDHPLQLQVVSDFIGQIIERKQLRVINVDARDTNGTDTEDPD